MRFRQFVLAAAFLAALCVFLTWPQAASFASAVPDHNDPYFSIWRLSWIAHSLRVDPHHLFDGNIFYPESRTLAYSDAVLLEGATAAPLLWAGVPAAEVYNIELFAGIILSGIGMLILVWHLTRNDDAALLAAAIFVLIPYRVEHVMHLELQWTGWIPLAFWSLHRAFESRSVRFALLTAMFGLLQLLSCVYYGVFLLFPLAILAVAITASQRELPARVAAGLALGAVIVTPVALLYTLPYIQNARTLGIRPVDEVTRFSAVPLSYFAAPALNGFWGWTAGWFTGDELHLFPGAVAVILALSAFASRRRRILWVYVALCAFAVEMSFGLKGSLYPWLRDHLFLLRGFRASARFSIFAFCALAVLAGLGFEWMNERLARSGRRVPLFAVVVIAIAFECGSRIVPFARIDRGTPDVYAMLQRLPPRAVAEFPMAKSTAIPGYDPWYMVWSTRHWRPLVNGYSGFVSREYVSTLEEVAGFPDDRSIRRLASLGAGYVVVHEFLYEKKERQPLLLAIGGQPALVLLGEVRDFQANSHARIFEIRADALK